MGLALALCLTLGACSGPGPEVTVRNFYRALAAYGESQHVGLLRVAFELMDSDTKSTLERRASNSPGGVAPWELMDFRGFLLGDRVSDIRVTEQGDGQAKVQITFERY